MSFRRAIAVALCCVLLATNAGRLSTSASAQEPTGTPSAATPGDLGSVSQINDDSSGSTAGKSDGMNFLRLLLLGGWFMIPLAVISLAVVALAVERGLALRRERLIPHRFVDRLGRLADQAGGMDPRDAYKVAQAYPSSASVILRKVLVKVGRPHAELESALGDAAQRNAIQLQQPVSWLSWCAAVAPLIGLLGTVWGITQAFYDTTQLQVGENQAEALANGIYMALVTTIFGLVIAIPATTFAHYYENRIVSISGEIEELISSLLPQLERYEGQIRFTVEEVPGTAAPPSSSMPGSKTVRRAADDLPGPERRTRAST